MKKSFALAVMVGVLTLFTAGTAMADEWNQDISGACQYVDSEGYAFSNGWKEIDGKWYYFNQNGWMLTNEITPDGYQVGADGVMVSNESTDKPASSDGALSDWTKREQTKWEDIFSLCNFNSLYGQSGFTITEDVGDMTAGEKRCALDSVKMILIYAYTEPYKVKGAYYYAYSKEKVDMFLEETLNLDFPDLQESSGSPFMIGNNNYICTGGDFGGSWPICIIDSYKVNSSDEVVIKGRVGMEDDDGNKELRPFNAKLEHNPGNQYSKYQLLEFSY